MLNKDMASYNIDNVAIVFNGVKNRGFGKYSYGFGHGYGYDIRSSYEEYSKKIKKISWIARLPSNYPLFTFFSTILKYYSIVNHTINMVF